MIEADACPLCRGRHSARYYDFGAPGRIAVHNRVCDDCGMIFQSPRLDDAEMARYYANYMGETQPGIAHVPLSFEAHIQAISRLRLRHLRPFLRAGMRVLDIGCSFGAMLATLRDESGLAMDLVGVNPEASLARFGQQRHGLDIRIGMFEAMRFETDSFDLVILDNVIEHFADPTASVAAITRLLAGDGLLLVVTNNAMLPHGFHWQNFFLDHTVTFTPKTLRALLAAHGFRVETMDDAGHVTHLGYHYPYTTCIARKTGLPSPLDRSSLAGHAREMRDFPARYRRETYRVDGLAKRLYEWSLSSHPMVRRLSRQIVAGGRRVGFDLDFQLPPHTLPPDDLRPHWVFAAFCDSYDDGAKAIALSRDTGMNAEFHLFRRTEREGGYTLAMTPSPERLRRFSDAAEALGWLVDAGRRPDLLIAARLERSGPVADEVARDIIAFVRSEPPRLIRHSGDEFFLAAVRPSGFDGLAALFDGRRS